MTVTYRSQEFGVFAQNDWRLGNRMRLNAGLRYDIDLNLRLNDFYGRALDDPNFRGLDRFISRDRGTDTNNLQPRLGATWDSRGDGTLIVRGGWGVYVTRNRPWIQIRSMNQFASSAVRITDPDATAALPRYHRGPRRPQLDEYLAAVGGRQLGTVIPDDFVQPYALNTTIGAGWQVNPTTTLDVDYVHSYANHQTGSTDVNLPPSGAVSAANPRPVANFSQVDDGRELHQELVRRRRNAVAIADRVARFVAGVLYAVAQLPRWRRLLHDDARDAADAARARLQPVGPAPQPDGRRHGGFAVVHSGEWDPEAD